MTVTNIAETMEIAMSLSILIMAHLIFLDADSMPMTGNVETFT